MSLAGRAWAVATTLAAPGLRTMLRRRARRGKELPERLPERWGAGSVARPEGPLLWVHAASVGESRSVLPLVERLEQAGVAVLMTTGTVTSARLLEGRVRHRFVPLDVPRWAGRFLAAWRPDAAVFVESELWPNLLAACRARGVPLALVNARMSARSEAGWRRAPGFAREVLGGFAWVHPQTEADGARLRALGARAVLAPGNLKAAAPPLEADAAELARLRALIGARPAWLAASTHPGEEQAAAAVHQALAARVPDLLTILAPRHPERGPALAAEFGAPRRGAGQDPAGGIWIADTLGEMGLLYRLAPACFVGGSLVAMGGQNPLEAARLGLALAIGPHVENCRESVERLEDAGGLTRVANVPALATWLGRMLSGDAAEAGARAQAAADGDPALPERLSAAVLGLLR